jgi:hypothetical protein
MRVEQEFHLLLHAFPSHDFATYERRASAGSDTAASNISRTRGQSFGVGGMGCTRSDSSVGTGLARSGVCDVLSYSFLLLRSVIALGTDHVRCLSGPIIPGICVYSTEHARTFLAAEGLDVDAKRKRIRR